MTTAFVRQMPHRQPTVLELAEELREAKATAQMALGRVEQIAEQIVYARLRDELHPASFDELLTVPGAAEVLKVDPATVYQFISTGGLPVERIGESKRIRIRRRALDQWITERSKA